MLVLIFAMTSCIGMSKYEKRLEDDYTVKFLDEDEFDEMFDIFELDADDYGIEKVLIAGNKKSEAEFILVVECDSKKAAKDLYGDFKFIIDDDTEDVAIEGKFVIAGYEKIVKDAIGE